MKLFPSPLRHLFLGSRLALIPMTAALVAALTACGGGGGGEGTSAGSSADSAAAPAPGAATPAGPRPELPAARRSARVFVTGHSLVDNPLPDDLVQIANSLGGTSEYNQQNVLGSPLRVRTRGLNSASSDWSGYRLGKNREGQNMDVLAEIARPQTVSGTYDALLLTERHDLVSSLLFEDTIRYARHYHDRVAAAQPSATTYFYQSWQGLRDKNAPAEWIAYERAASPVWTCMATRLNQSLVAEGRSSRVVPLPAGAALAELVERATQGTVAGITGASVRETVDRLIEDDVHPTRLGMYYMALVSYAAIYRQSPVGAWRPADVTAAQAASLQNVAWDTVSRREAETPLDLGQCAATLRDSFCSTYATYMRDASQAASCQSRFAAGRTDHPFHFDAASDRNLWLPSP
ncbi:MAG: hypothetical protein V4739_14095 [Pseudomonadota bacterium]